MIATSSPTSSSRTVGQQSVRLVIEAHCTICGPIGDQATEGISVVRTAQAHSAGTSHVVILNGTTDLPEADETQLLRS